MRLVFAGTPQVAVPCLDALADSDHDLVAVVTRPDAPMGRSKKPVESPVAQRAKSLGVPVLKPPHPGDREFLDELRALQPDCCPVVAYGALLTEAALAIPVHGWANLHFSLLPRWRGAAPVQRAIMAGDRWTGICVFDIVKQLDAGDVYAQIRVPVEERETAGSLLTRLAYTGAKLLVDVMDDIGSGTATLTPQPRGGITLARKVTTADARVDWAKTDAEIDRRIRGCTPAPGAWTTFRGERFKIIAAHPAGGPPRDPGSIEATKTRILVGTGSRPLQLDQVQPPGKKPMGGTDWARGATLSVGDGFE